MQAHLKIVDAEPQQVLRITRQLILGIPPETFRSMSAILAAAKRLLAALAASIVAPSDEKGWAIFSTADYAQCRLWASPSQILAAAAAATGGVR